ncbi:MAG: 3-phosphoshikimate 1-carboxyvinyltransferase [Pseudomonadota bacterium]|nr:3-phosphoshikimate 1-carboxyvinyltransferase [Pseudomonadota bacterium]
MSLTVRPAPNPLRGRLRVPGDKSISHRAVLFGALARGTTRFAGLLEGEDVLATLAAVRALGCDASTTHVTGAPWRDVGLVDCGNSGTTARLLLGALAPRAGASLDGDASLRGRPMRRVTDPLGRMGASFTGGPGLPIRVEKRRLSGVTVEAAVASAQVKSAVLLAGLRAEGETRYVEPIATRDHTERLLTAMGAPLRREGTTLVVSEGELDALAITVPGDISSAAFWMVAAAIVPGSDLVIEGVGLNPTRTGVIDVLVRMGVAIEVDRVDAPEPYGTVRVRGGALRGTRIDGPLIPRLIDEIPVLAVAAAFAEGETTFADAAELRVKESDRVATTVAGLRALGIDADARPDGLVVRGTPGAVPPGLSEPYPFIDSAGDHRIAMAFAIAGLRLGAHVRGAACIATSYPSFHSTLARFAGA